MKIIFITGTRADFGKLKPLIKKFYFDHDTTVVTTGMHLIPELGNTFLEVEKLFPKSIVKISGQKFNENMIEGFSRFMLGFKRYLLELLAAPDVVVVHGDRFDALAASIVCNEMNIRVCHIEGGEVSGTIDESIRHSVSKFSHIHFVANAKAKERILKLGENPNSVFVSGSPETDVILGNDLPKISDTKNRYDIPFEEYIIFCLHPVVSEVCSINLQMKEILLFLNYIKIPIIWIYPNNDEGSSIIRDSITSSNISELKFFESLRFEHYITLLKNAKAIIGNSSSGVREAPVLGVPSINIGSRQEGRVDSEIVLNTLPNFENLKLSWDKVSEIVNKTPIHNFGSGNVSSFIFNKLTTVDLNQFDRQKKYHE